MPSVSIPFNQLCGLQVSVPLDPTSLSGTPFQYTNTSNRVTRLPLLNGWSSLLDTPPILAYSFISSIEGSNAEGSINIETGEDDHGRPVIRFTASPNVSVPTNPSEAIDRGLYFCHAYLPNRLDTYRNMIGGSSVWGASPSSMPASSLDNYVSTSSTFSSALLFQDTRNKPTDTSSPASVLPQLVDNSLWFENRNCSYICEIQQGYNLIQCLF